jgi:hypothetical protein
MKSVCAIHRVPVKVYPLQDPDFEWPTLETMVASQLEHEAQRLQLMSRGVELVHDWIYWRWTNGAVWIPEMDVGLQLRLYVVAHFGMTGHRGAKNI